MAYELLMGIIKLMLLFFGALVLTALLPVLGAIFAGALSLLGSGLRRLRGDPDPGTKRTLAPGKPEEKPDRNK